MSRSIREHADAARQKLRQLQHKVEEKALLQMPAMGEGSDSDTSQPVREIVNQDPYTLSSTPSIVCIFSLHIGLYTHFMLRISLLFSFLYSLEHLSSTPSVPSATIFSSTLPVNLFHMS